MAKAIWKTISFQAKLTEKQEKLIKDHLFRWMKDSLGIWDVCALDMDDHCDQDEDDEEDDSPSLIDTIIDAGGRILHKLTDSDDDEDCVEDPIENSHENDEFPDTIEIPDDDILDDLHDEIEKESGNSRINSDYAKLVMQYAESFKKKKKDFLRSK